MPTELEKINVKGVIRRRKKIFFTTFSLIFFSFVVVAFVLPPLYKSEVMIIVEDQEIPEEYVKSTMNTFLSERLEVLSKKILSYANLVEIAKENRLYTDIKSDLKIYQNMREDIELETVDVSLKESASGRGFATIAFVLSYMCNNAEDAKSVVDTLGNLFVQEDKREREKQALATTTFLEKELEELRLQVQLNEEKISRFKAQNINQLPGSTAIFSQTIYRLEQEIKNIDTRIRTIQEKNVYLKSQISNIDPLIPIVTETGKVANNPNNRLKYLRLQLIQMQSTLSGKHPDIVRLKNEIKELEAQVGVSSANSEAANQLFLVNRELLELKATYGENHPDVVRLTREAELLRRQASLEESTKLNEDQLVDNPGYMNIKAQIIAAEAEVEALKAERVKLTVQIDDYQRRLERSPFIDEEYNALTLDYENAKKKYNEASNKLYAARLSMEVDTSEKGARFRIDNPAYLPDRPFKPKRLLIVFMGIVVGFGAAISLAALLEGLDSSVKVADELESLAGVPVLATVSFVDSPKQKRKRVLKGATIAAMVMVLLLVVTLMINWFVVPVDRLWATFEDRLIEVGVPIERDPAKL